MLNAVDFVSKNVFEAIAPCEDQAVISIGDPAEPAPRSLEAHRRALRLEFLDCDLAGVEKWDFPLDALFSKEHALALFDFVRMLDEDSQSWRLVVHCHAGISRSAAVAAVAAAMTGCEFPRREDAHYANRHVLKTTEQVLGFQVPAPEVPQPGTLHEYLPTSALLI